MKGLFNVVIEVLLSLIPRYIEDRVALSFSDDEWRVYCLESQVEPEDRACIHAYGTIRTFTWLGFANGGKVTLDD